MLQVYSHSYDWSNILFLFYFAYSAFFLYLYIMPVIWHVLPWDKRLQSIEKYCFGTKLQMFQTGFSLQCVPLMTLHGIT